MYEMHLLWALVFPHLPAPRDCAATAMACRAAWAASTDPVVVTDWAERRLAICSGIDPGRALAWAARAGVVTRLHSRPPNARTVVHAIETLCAGGGSAAQVGALVSRAWTWGQGKRAASAAFLAACVHGREDVVRLFERCVSDSNNADDNERAMVALRVASGLMAEDRWGIAMLAIEHPDAVDITSAGAALARACGHVSTAEAVAEAVDHCLCLPQNMSVPGKGSMG